MNKAQVFSIWAPEDSPWSAWAKPVLFAHLDLTHLHVANDAPQTALDEVAWAPPADGKVALVLNLPGAAGVLAAVALVSRGYRPVPLYNAVPLAAAGPAPAGTRSWAMAAVDVLPIVCALKTQSEALHQLTLPASAPPAFLLDFNRSGGGRPRDDVFDNRSVAFTTDFPSAIFLVASGIERVILVQKDDLVIQADLAHILRRWQEGGIKLESLRLDPLSQPEPFEVPRPSWFGAMFQRVIVQLGFRRAPTGGFGGWMMDSSSGG